MDTELELLENALAFYANKDNWCSPSRGFVAQYDPEPSPMDNDAGSRAKAALYVLEALRTKTNKDDYTYPTIGDYENLVGFKVSKAFVSGWRMARTTDSMLGIKE